MIDLLENNAKLKNIIIASFTALTFIVLALFLYIFGKEVGQILYQIVNNITC